MKVNEVINNNEPAKKAVDALKLNAKQAQQRAKAAAARLKVQQGQQQLQQANQQQPMKMPS